MCQAPLLFNGLVMATCVVFDEHPIQFPHEELRIRN